MANVLNTRASDSAERKFTVNPSAPSTGTEAWGYGQDETDSVNFGVWPEEHEDAEKTIKTSDPQSGGKSPSTALDQPTHGAPDDAAVQDAAVHEDKIRLRAYEIYEARGRIDGQASDDWEQATAEMSRSR